MKAKLIKNQPKTREVAFNPMTRKWQVVNVEDETTGNQRIMQYWSGGLNKWVTIPE